jgi:hypothetical protein
MTDQKRIINDALVEWSVNVSETLPL